MDTEDIDGVDFEHPSSTYLGQHKRYLDPILTQGRGTPWVGYWSSALHLQM